MAVDRPLPNRRLLVVDPDLSIARDVAKRCERLGFECFAVNRSNQALEVYLHKLPAVVLVEMLLPDGNGLDLIGEIRKFDWSHASRVYLHSFVRGSLEVVKTDAKRAGADGLFPKPFDEEALLELAPLQAYESSEASQHPYDLPSASSNLAHADTLLDPRAQEREPASATKTALKFGPAGLSVSPDAEPEPAKPIDLDDDLDLGFDDVGLGEDTELDAWLEGLTSGDSGRTVQPSEPAPDDAETSGSRARAPSWTPTDAGIVTIEGALSRDTLLAILAAAWREDWFGRIRIESGRLWTELSVGEGLLWTVTCDETGPSVIDVGFRHGLMAARDLGRLSDELREQGERLASRVLRGAGASEEGIDRILELTAIERVMSAFESREGTYRCLENLPPTSESFEARLPLSQLISMAVDRHVPVMRAVDRYAGQEQEVVRKRARFDELAPPLLSDRFSRDAVANLGAGEPLLKWIQKNPSNPGALFLLLTKLLEVGAVALGLNPPPPAFTFGRDGDQQSGSLTAVTIPATPKQTSKRIAEMSDAPLLRGAPQVVPAAEASPDEPEEPTTRYEPLDEPLDEELWQDEKTARVDLSLPDGDAPASEKAAEPTVNVVGDVDEPAARPSIPRPTGPLEGAGFAASLEQLRVSGELPAVENTETSKATWQPGVFLALDRWEIGAARDELQARLIEAPEDAQAAAYEAWLTFARSLKGGRGGADPGDALNELEHVLEAAPSCPDPYFLLGLAAISLGNSKQALSHLDAGLSVSPDDVPMNVCVGLVRAGYYDHPKADLSPRGVWRTVRTIAR